MRVLRQHGDSPMWFTGWHFERGHWWFRIYGYGLAFKSTRDYVLFSTRWRRRPALHIGVNPNYPGDGRVAPLGKPVGRWVLELLTP